MEALVRLRIAAVDFISNTCFPALAADELGFFKAEGLDARIELVAMLGATKALRDGSADAMVAGSVHDVLTEFPDWRGAKIVVALSQGTPWLLVVRADLAAKRGDINAVRGLRLSAAEGPDLALRQMLIGDGIWANAMGGETAISRGAGKILVDVRRGDDPDEVRYFTFAGMATTDNFVAREPEVIAAAVRAIVKAQKALRNDPSLAQDVGRRKFPKDAAELIARVVERDVPFYNPVISEEAVAKMNRFAQSVGHLSGPVPYANVVAIRFRELWDA